jgi:hypothetical protein
MSPNYRIQVLHMYISVSAMSMKCPQSGECQENVGMEFVVLFGHLEKWRGLEWTVEVKLSPILRQEVRESSNRTERRPMGN